MDYPLTTAVGIVGTVRTATGGLIVRTENTPFNPARNGRTNSAFVFSESRLAMLIMQLGLLDTDELVDYIALGDARLEFTVEGEHSEGDEYTKADNTTGYFKSDGYTIRGEEIKLGDLAQEVIAEVKLDARKAGHLERIKANAEKQSSILEKMRQGRQAQQAPTTPVAPPEGDDATIAKIEALEKKIATAEEKRDRVTTEASKKKHQETIDAWQAEIVDLEATLKKAE